MRDSRGLFGGNYGFIIAVLAVTLLFAIVIISQIQNSQSAPVQAMRDVYYSAFGAFVGPEPTASPTASPSASPPPSPSPAPTVSPVGGK